MSSVSTLAFHGPRRVRPLPAPNYPGYVCNDWTGTGNTVGGLPSNGGFGWGSGVVVSSARLQCFGTDLTKTVTVTPVPGRKTFLSTGNFTPSTGIAAADTLCANEAADAGFAGTYTAFLQTTGAQAASRFNTTGLPWVRTDGVPIVAQASDITTFKLVAPIERRANGSLGQGSVWTGGNGGGLTSNSTCTDWTSSLPTGQTTNAAEADGAWFGNNFSASCSTARPVFCLQQ